MYKDNGIDLKVYETYYECVDLLKAKGATIYKLENLIEILTYFNNEYDTFNENEKKLVKNVIEISKGITNRIHSCNNFYKKQLEECKTLQQSLFIKQKEPIK